MEDAIEWDFRTLVDGWILYGLPVLLSAVVVAVLVRRRSRPSTSANDDSALIVRRVGLIHCALTAQAVISLAQVLLTMRIMGIPESFITLVVGLITTAVNPILAVGLWRFSRNTRRFALAWYVLLSVISGEEVWRIIYYQIRIDPAQWPEQAAWKILPIFLLVAMLSPRIKRLFAKGAREQPTAESSSSVGATAPAVASRGSSAGSLLALLFLFIVCSNLIVDMTDWGYRLVFDTESLP